MRSELAQLEHTIHEQAGVVFNLNSTPQLRHVLFEKLQLPVLKKGKTGASTDAEVLEGREAAPPLTAHEGTPLARLLARGDQLGKK